MMAGEAHDNNERSNLLWDIRRSIRYHMARRRFFERCNTTITFMSVLSGAAVVVSLIKDAPPAIGVGFATAVTAMQLADLVWGTAQRATRHSDLARRFINLERDTIAASGTAMAALTARRLDIEADEPPILRRLDLLCHNELSRATFGDQANTFVVGWWQSRFAHWFDLGTVEVKRPENG